MFRHFGKSLLLVLQKGKNKFFSFFSERPDAKSASFENCFNIHVNYKTVEKIYRKMVESLRSV